MAKMFTKALSILEETWKSFKWAPKGKQFNKICYMYATECYVALTWWCVSIFNDISTCFFYLKKVSYKIAGIISNFRLKIDGVHLCTVYVNPPETWKHVVEMLVEVVSQWCCWLLCCWAKCIFFFILLILS